MLKEKFDLKYFLGSRFLHEGSEIEIGSIDWQAPDKKYYEVTQLGWVSDEFLDSLEAIELT
jgi:hypothetical protein